MTSVRVNGAVGGQWASKGLVFAWTIGKMKVWL